MKPHFGKQLKAARVAKGYTQKALAAILGMDGNTVARLERGEHGIRWANLEKLVEVLEQPATYYFSSIQPEIAPSPSPTPEEALEIIAREIRKPKLMPEPEISPEIARIVAAISQAAGDEIKLSRIRGYIERVTGVDLTSDLIEKTLKSSEN